ncbi:unnamed protein product [Cylicocyclus nassatus]|uniref:Uncharacterized protein n=1 Tax=Cylicocyclus nassatus TaxID=53992 RepID=A0AA36H5T4_CYLNA|nr:unnamed protein product [Cylicocyclus nassatus]
MILTCAVCESPTAQSAHFGARTCKACAAFFRRTVSAKLVYKCREEASCTIHYEKRMLCRKCRYDKCIAAGMSRNLVQSMRATAHTLLVSQCSAEKNCNPSTFDSPRISPSDRGIGTEERKCVVEHYTRIEADLNSRRRMLYTNTKMSNIFTTRCECPFEKQDLKPFNYKTFVGNSRSDFIMLYGYTTGFMQFDDLDPAEKQTLYRYTCAVDMFLNSAYFTSRISFNEKRIATIGCEYICVEGTPMTGDEPWAQHLFANREDQDRYKSIVPRHVALWKSLIVPFHRLRLQFDEFCALKALICWHISHYKLGANGRRICSNQRNLIIKCLNDMACERSSCPEEWMGNLILFISCVVKEIIELVNSLVMITFFNIFDCDSVIKDLMENESY